eukprot:3298960-Pyramimonas_sp.AAC.1
MSLWFADGGRLPDTHKEWLRGAFPGLLLDVCRAWGCSLRSGQTPIRSSFGVLEVAFVISVCQIVRLRRLPDTP